MGWDVDVEGGPGGRTSACTWQESTWTRYLPENRAHQLLNSTSIIVAAVQLAQTPFLGLDVLWSTFESPEDIQELV